MILDIGMPGVKDQDLSPLPFKARSHEEAGIGGASSLPAPFRKTQESNLIGQAQVTCLCLAQPLRPGGRLLGLAAPAEVPYSELGRSLLQREPQGSVSGRGGAEQSKHRGLGLGLGHSALFWDSSVGGEEGQVSTQ